MDDLEELQEARKVGLERNILLMFGLRQAYASLTITVATISLFWQAGQVGLTQSFLLQAIFAAVLAIFEVPSGYIADICTRRLTLSIGGLFLLFGTIFYGLSGNFQEFLIAEVLLAVGFALISGADEALLYDTLLELGRELQYSQLWSRIAFFELSVGALLAVAGGFIAQFGLRWPYLFAVIGYLIYLLICSQFTEPKRVKLLVQGGHCNELLQIARRSYFEDRRLGWLMLFYGITMGVSCVAVWIYQPYYVVIGLPVAYFGLAFAAIQVSAAVIVRLIPALQKRFSRPVLLMLMVVSQSVGFAGLGMFGNLGGLVFLLIPQVARAMNRIVISTYVNELTDSSVRATVISLQSLVFRGCYVVALLIYSLLMNDDQVLMGLFGLGILSLLGGSIAAFCYLSNCLVAEAANKDREAEELLAVEVSV